MVIVSVWVSVRECIREKIRYEEGWGLERLGIGGDRPYPSSLNSNNNQSLNPWPYILNSILNNLTISS